ncbi:PhnB protein [Stackebrandtia albiflava]|uniref:PhnB protein n=1 Tax=Stackebrandtia albiflava TaxID=406432 RepID=A0A562VDG7_9ACTN|nr:VOC family protein [Stackebrandtia albiflava]TWJ15905.1 PhnB protein [Stackebrandtia albiflava]
MGWQLNPYLNFDGNARQAMEFYRDVLGGDLTVSTFGEFGGEGDTSDKVMHAQLSGGGLTLMASDTAPGMEYRPGTNVALSLSGDDDATLRRYWEGLSQDGTITVPLEEQMWGDVFGAVTDRFGINWMVNIGRPE